MEVQVEIADNRRNGRKFKNVTPEDFWRRMQKPVGCWLYDGAKEINGYGHLKNPLGDTPKYIAAHRLSWILTNGPIPEGMRVLHKCDVRACCNPEHLFLGTDADNAADRHAKKRSYRGQDMHTAKLNDEKVLELRKLRAEGWSKQALGEKYGIKPHSAYLIYSRRTWKHLP
jgi:hypothetical protein